MDFMCEIIVYILYANRTKSCVRVALGVLS